MTSGPPISVSRSGILFVDKPAGITSHGVVSRVRKIANTRKVGHAGTLDPMATGLLTVGINSSTRLLTFLVGLDKEYLATIRLGAATGTDDAEGAVTTVADPIELEAVTDEQVRSAILPLTGVISQVPSSVSAIRIDGRRAYEMARAGEEVILTSREVTVSAFEVLAMRRGTAEIQRTDPAASATEAIVESDGSAEPGGQPALLTETVGYIDIDVRVECSSGTYIRALARDLGATLGVGGHLTVLRRSRVGPFSVVDAATLETLDPDSDLVSAADVAARLFASVTLTDEQLVSLTQGKRLPGFEPDGSPIAALSPSGRLVSIVEISSGVLRPIVNFPTNEVLA
ncbi:MAG: tRNA pseudouridine(55) synthase TruB [Glaciihabitans sp.]|nr:tRNA pseudouridine(55) synthase TruB [Glaciihabitans sp.]